MTMLRVLLDTWQTWSTRDTLTRALDTTPTEDQRVRISSSLAGLPDTTALDALQASAELVELLTGWQWQAMYAARRDGASWEQIATAAHTTDAAARAAYTAVVDRQESVLGRDVSTYREVL